MVDRISASMFFPRELGRPVRERLQKSVPSYVVVNGLWVAVTNVVALDQDAFIETMSRNQIVLEYARLFFSISDDLLRELEGECSWYVVKQDSHNSCYVENSISDFAQLLPEPCQHDGRLKQGVAIKLDSKPKGHVMAAGSNLAVSCKFLAAGDFSKQAILSDVLYRDVVLLNWKGLDVSSRCSVISNDSLKPSIQCFGCHTELRPCKGVWIARADPSMDSEFALDNTGEGHAGIDWPLVVSSQFAQKLISKVGRTGYRLTPVFSADSAVAHAVLRFEAAIKRYEMESHLGNKSGQDSFCWSQRGVGGGIRAGKES